MSSILVYGFLVISIIGALSGISYTIYSAGYDKAALEYEEAARVTRLESEARISKAAEELERVRQQRKVVYRTITRSVDKIVDRPIYRNTCLDADGVQLANDALLGRSPTAGKPPAAVPPASPDGERAGSDGNAKVD